MYGNGARIGMRRIITVKKFRTIPGDLIRAKLTVPGAGALVTIGKGIFCAARTEMRMCHGTAMLMSDFDASGNFVRSFIDCVRLGKCRTQSIKV